MLFDTHAHLNDQEAFADVAPVLARARSAGVRRIVVPSYDRASCLRALALCEQYPGLYAAVGFHPNDAQSVTEQDLVDLAQWLSHEKVVAVGEIGLDYHYDTPRDVQIGLLQVQVDMAKRAGKPVIIHDREAHEDIVRILGEQGVDQVGGIMHCFSGSVEMMHQCLALNLHISLGGPVTFKNAKKPVQVAQAVPAQRLLVETDSPWLAPHPHRGKPNEPAYVQLVAQTIAQVRAVTEETLAQETWRNACEVFGLPQVLGDGEGI